jgi:hypothetical protein
MVVIGRFQSCFSLELWLRCMAMRTRLAIYSRKHTEMDSKSGMVTTNTYSPFLDVEIYEVPWLQHVRHVQAPANLGSFGPQIFSTSTPNIIAARLIYRA